MAKVNNELVFRLIKRGEPSLEEVIALAKQNSVTLGFMPKDAFVAHADKGMLLGVLDGTSLIGYCLFRIANSKQRISIAHLCIAKSARRKGIGKKVINWLHEQYGKLYRGISLSCREDFESAVKFYQDCNFQFRDRTLSRSKQEKYLIKFWYDFNKPDLFTKESSGRIEAVIDLNIIIKL
ncbi:MAG TPA: GNAT family N-acetyltransferase, partial [Cyclobacteriaceae bacterium]